MLVRLIPVSKRGTRTLIFLYILHVKSCYLKNIHITTFQKILRPLQSINFVDFNRTGLAIATRHANPYSRPVVTSLRALVTSQSPITTVWSGSYRVSWMLFWDSNRTLSHSALRARLAHIKQQNIYRKTASPITTYKCFHFVTDWGLVMHLCGEGLGQHWLSLWFVSCSVPSHYPKRCRLIVS